MRVSGSRRSSEKYAYALPLIVVEQLSIALQENDAEPARESTGDVKVDDAEQ